MRHPRSHRSLLALAGAATVVLAACGASAPPGKELADEVIDTLDVSDAVKQCMHSEVADFQLTDDDLQGFNDFDEVAQKAADGQDKALAIMRRFQDAIASCNSAG